MMFTIPRLNLSIISFIFILLLTCLSSSTDAHFSQLGPTKTLSSSKCRSNTKQPSLSSPNSKSRWNWFRASRSEYQGYPITPTTSPEFPRGGDSSSSCSTSSSLSSLPPSKTATTTALKNALASALSAGTVKLLLAPFDTLKTLQQSSIRSPLTPDLTLLSAFQLLMARGGVMEMYSGIGVVVLGSMPSVGLYFGVYHYCKRKGLERLANRTGKKVVPVGKGMVTVNVAVSAAIGNTVASFSRVPYEVVKQKLQTGVYPSTIIAITSMYKEEGMYAFFPKGGVAVQMVRDIPYAVVTLLCYEYLQENYVIPRKKLISNRKSEIGETDKQYKLSPRALDMAAGAFAGGLGSLLTNPMDVVKTRIQTSPSLYLSIFDCASKTYSGEGAGAFFKGAGVRLMHKVPANGLFFLVYEGFRTAFGA